MQLRGKKMKKKICLLTQASPRSGSRKKDGGLKESAGLGEYTLRESKRRSGGDGPQFGEKDLFSPF